MQKQQPNKDEAVLGLRHLYRCHRNLDTEWLNGNEWILTPLKNRSLVVSRSPLGYTGKGWSCYRDWDYPGYKFHTQDFYAIRDTECWRTQWSYGLVAVEQRTQLLLVVFKAINDAETATK